MGITIKEIAKLADVSKSTVSRVINDSEHVSDEARKKVQQVIEETGYIPNSLAKDLQRNKTNTIGVILPKINTSTFSSAVEGISDTMHENGYNILLTNTRLNTKEEINHLKLLKEKRVRGILFFATEVTKEHIETLERIDIPVVILGQDTSDILDFPCVIHDDFVSAQNIVGYLVAHGHKNIGYIGVEEYDIAVGQLRKKGYEAVLTENNLEINEEQIYKDGFSMESGYKGMLEIINNSQKLPTAIFAATDRLAIGAIKCLKDKGYQVPEDVSIVGIGDSDISPLITPELTTVRYDHLQAGAKASQILLNYINKQEVTEKLVMNSQIIERESVKNV
ncbi:transcriptional regulator [Halobacteroides halobius DSM 5150]|uniref:Transcriptional regulator n=1 Tax=Halobacteroides halobius (strain ATCC 35273 / DSM 5150 / MD-1) TaxID=748449 RepID=L0K734_HALHC|nr:LacI family DNA-binding transcriptional regulator [Halobacteroides halobius]AGB40801.1 transcriptional regulator [Halobacteroides halobius DSM 5150]